MFKSSLCSMIIVNSVVCTFDRSKLCNSFYNWKKVFKKIILTIKYEKHPPAYFISNVKEP